MSLHELPFRRMHEVASSARILSHKLLLPFGDNAHRGGKDAEQFAVWYGDEKEEADDILLSVRS